MKSKYFLLFLTVLTDLFTPHDMVANQESRLSGPGS
jgi:hypothetical protein